jgi:regulator of protease activity HflC (stomatin/prohibitin superfamily)
MEKIADKTSGYLMIILFFLIIGTSIWSISQQFFFVAIPGFLLSFSILPGFMIINPTESLVLILFGKYMGTIKESGFFWANPFLVKKKISLRARNLASSIIKVNDKNGNPIEIASVIVWCVNETAKAAFEVDDYTHYIKVQCEAALSHLAGICPYDSFEEEHKNEITLRGGGEKIKKLLEDELQERLMKAGIHVIEARISHLAYATEIAGAMLQRQQASAIVSARKQIVEGAVGMVEMALEKLSERNVVQLDEERKASMVSNLLVVLCGDKNVSPVVNTGTLYN